MGSCCLLGVARGGSVLGVLLFPPGNTVLHWCYRGCLSRQIFGKKPFLRGLRVDARVFGTNTSQAHPLQPTSLGRWLEGCSWESYCRAECMDATPWTEPHKGTIRGALPTLLHPGPSRLEDPGRPAPWPPSGARSTAVAVSPSLAWARLAANKHLNIACAYLYPPSADRGLWSAKGAKQMGTSPGIQIQHLVARHRTRIPGDSPPLNLTV